jgi:hypothetical protein
MVKKAKAERVAPRLHTPPDAMVITVLYVRALSARLATYNPLNVRWFTAFSIPS